jgi:hypothetical protein
MTPKEEAKELIQKFYPNVQWKLGQEDCLQRAKNCALIAVDKIINLMVIILKWDEKTNGNIHYWKEVKQEIENYEL